MIDAIKVSINHVTVVHISLVQTNDNSLDDFYQAIKGIPEVQSCLMIAGQFDYMLKVSTRDITHFRELLGERISKLPDVMQTHSFAVMETVKEISWLQMGD